MSITKIVVSPSTMQAVVYDGQDAMALLLKTSLESSKEELRTDAESGKLGLYMMLSGADDQENIDSTLAEASDWETVYGE